MNDYIRRQDAVEETLKYIISSGVSNQSTWNECVRTIADTLQDMQPADVVPVVRCKDCKHHSFDAGYGNYWCNLTSGVRKVKRFDFCSYGERREE